MGQVERGLIARGELLQGEMTDYRTEIPQAIQDLPEWSRPFVEPRLPSVLKARLDQISENPKDFCPKFRDDYDISPKDLVLLSEKVGKLLGKKYGLVAEESERLKSEINENTDLPDLGEEVDKAITELTDIIHFGVLREIAKSLPSHKAALHRGSYERVKKDLPGKFIRVGEQVLANERIPIAVRHFLGIVVKGTTFCIDETRENIRRGIGGFELDLQYHEGQSGKIVPVVSHASKEEELNEAPTLEDTLEMVRELLEDPSRPVRRGLSLFIDVKTTDAEVLKKTLEIIDKKSLGHHVFFVTSKPEVIKTIRHLQEELTTESPERAQARYVYSWPRPNKEIAEILSETMEIPREGEEPKPPYKIKSRVQWHAFLYKEPFVSYLRRFFPDIGVHLVATADNSERIKVLKNYKSILVASKQTAKVNEDEKGV